MKKISKRFLTLAITCVMAMAMAVPAFADWTIEVDDNSNRYINVYGTYGSSLNGPSSSWMVNMIPSRQILLHRKIQIEMQT